MKKVLGFLFVFSTLIQSQNIWQLSNGPYSNGGIVNSSTIDLNGQLYVGTSDSGLYYISNMGNEWSTSKLKGNSINSICASANGYIFATSYQLLFRSTDQGTNWVLISNGLPTANFNEVTCTLDNLVFLATSEGLFRSIDLGTNWERVDSGFFSSYIKGVVACDDGNIYSYLDSSIYRSSNSGSNWIELSKPPSGRITDFTFDNSSNLFLTINLLGVSVFIGYRSNDQGETWQQFGSSCPLFFHFVKVSPTGNLFVQGQYGFYKSTDKGEYWDQISSFTESTCLSFFSDEILFSGSFSGVWKSTNGGMEWTVVGLPINYPRITALTTNSTGIVFAGGAGNYPEIYKTTNHGQLWVKLESNFDGTAISSLELDENGNLFASSYGGGIYFSDDLGTTWFQRNNGLTDFEISSIAQDELGNAYVSTWNGNIFRSSNYGIQWAPINQGLNVIAIDDIVIASSGNIYIGTTDGVFVSTNQGMNWTQLTNGWGQVLSIAVNSLGHIFASNLGNGIYRSRDFGNSWTQVTTEIWSPIMDIFVNSIDTVFAAGANGVFRSTSNGDDWTLFNSGLAEFNSTNVLIADYDGKLIAGTDDRGVCWTSLSTTTLELIDNSLNKFYISQNYPNPFNPSTTIKYSISISEFVTLKVYDVLGNEITTLVNEEKQPGNYEIEFNGEMFSSGIYIYSISVGIFSSTKKMILLK